MKIIFKQFIILSFLVVSSVWAQSDSPDENTTVKEDSSKNELTTKSENKKDNVLDFSAGVIEGDLNRPSMLMELGSNYKEFNDLVLMREDFNSYHDLDSKFRFRYVDENL